MTPVIVAATGITRHPDDRLVAGVCSGLAARWRVDVTIVRFAAMALSLTGGIGVLLYIAGWILLPVADSAAVDTGGDDDTQRRPRPDEAAIVAIVLGTVLLLRSSGLWFSDRFGLVGGVAIVGVALVWGLTATPPSESSSTLRALRTAIGLVLLMGGAIAIAALWSNAEQLASAVAAAILMGAGIWLLIGPTIDRMSRELTSERRARVRSEEKAEIAAHLHDSVLQTLAVIQQRSSDPQLVSSLARRQERELRDWLYSSPATSTDAFAAAVRRELAMVEDTYGTRIEVVCVGDRGLDAPAQALVAALREAAVNAATHAGVGTIDVFAECTDDGVQAFVRDRGIGFDPDTVDGDRRGIADSIVGRMRRAGGTAVIRSAPGDGTEVSFTLGEDPS